MMTRRDFGGLAMGAVAMVADSQASAAPALQAQVDALLRAHIDAWNREDLDTMFAAFTPDAHWVNIVGMHWRGRDEVARAHRAFFNIMFRGVKQRLIETESVTPLPGGGAVVVARLGVDAFRQPNGVVKPPSEDRLTLVLVPRGDGLAIAHGANVSIAAEAQAHDPARRTS
jgi:uncharacterized protein (TIGR02246 family)